LVTDVDEPAVVLMAHNRFVTYGYTGEVEEDPFYYKIKAGSVIVDPWRTYPKDSNIYTVVHYGNTRKH